MKLLSVCLLVLALVSCTKKTSPTAGKAPEEVVKAFLEVSATAKEKKDREKLQELCVGELRRAFDRMTDEAFQISYANNNVKILDVKFLETKVTDDTARILYQVSIENKQGTDTTEETNQREVELTRVQGAWHIESIRAVGSDNIAFTRGMIF